MCEECEELEPNLHCTNCGQYLCLDCDKKIHNKGKRLEHIRNKINSGSEEYEEHPTDEFKDSNRKSDVYSVNQKIVEKS